MRRLAALAAGLTLALSPVATAQNYEPSDTTKRALAAGYKALFTCSGYFSAGQTLAEIQKNELSGIYVDYRPVMDEVGDANIVESSKSVLVAFDGALPPRTAAWRPGIGCSLLPIG
ncbi:MAG: serine hydrolase, partial [Henriciella sp.]|nr:serine hydrolase [Henriciella sp.]